MKPSISVIAAARRFLAIPLRSSHIPSGKKEWSYFYSPRLLVSPRSPPPPPLSLPSLCEMLTRCSAPTFIEMHPLIYPGSACSRLCLTSVLREVYYLTGERSPCPLLFLIVRLLLTPVTSPPLAFISFRPFPLTFVPLSILYGSTFNASHSKIIRIRFPDPVRVELCRGGQIMILNEGSEKKIYFRNTQHEFYRKVNKREIFSLAFATW